MPTLPVSVPMIHSSLRLWMWVLVSTAFERTTYGKWQLLRNFLTFALNAKFASMMVRHCDRSGCFAKVTFLLCPSLSISDERQWISLSDYAKYAPFGTKTGLVDSAPVQDNNESSSASNGAAAAQPPARPLTACPTIGDLVDARNASGVWYQVTSLVSAPCVAMNSCTYWNIAFIGMRNGYSRRRTNRSDGNSPRTRHSRSAGE